MRFFSFLVLVCLERRVWVLVIWIGLQIKLVVLLFWPIRGLLSPRSEEEYMQSSGGWRGRGQGRRDRRGGRNRGDRLWPCYYTLIFFFTMGMTIAWWCICITSDITKCYFLLANEEKSLCVWSICYNRLFTFLK